MFGWLGFGQKEEQSTEQDAQQSAEQIPSDDQKVNTQEEDVVEQSLKQETETIADSSDIASPSTDNTETVEETELTVDESTAEIDETQNDVAASAQLLAEMEAVEQDTESDELAHQSEENKLEQETDDVPSEVKAEKKPGFFARLKQGLSKTRQNLGGGLVDLFRGKQIDDELFEELETHLLMADVGVETTMKIIDSLTQSASRKQLKDASALYDLLKLELKNVIEGVSKPLVIPEGDGPFVILMVGVNGVGKTTTIGKLAKQFQADGKSVMLAAGDTFRAAAVEQLQVWGERNDIPVVAQHTGADSASVIFDAISAAKARKVDVIIADTAGRLQNKAHLMEELKKVVRVMKKLDVNAPHEVMLTIDAGTGQNALSQTKLFDEAVGLTGLTLTKLDGTAKGGVVFAVADKYNIPIRYLGVGEGIDDLRPFNDDDFIEAIFSN